MKWPASVEAFDAGQPASQGLKNNGNDKHGRGTSLSSKRVLQKLGKFAKASSIWLLILTLLQSRVSASLFLSTRSKGRISCRSNWFRELQ